MGPRALQDATIDFSATCGIAGAVPARRFCDSNMYRIEIAAQDAPTSLRNAGSFECRRRAEPVTAGINALPSQKLVGRVGPEMYTPEMKRALLLLAVVTPIWSQTAPAPASIKSPEVQDDHSVTFRFRAPNAKEVLLAAKAPHRVPMEKDDQGVWSITTEPLEPDSTAIRLSPTGSPDRSLQPLMKPNLLNTQSMVHVPGPASLPWEITDVPHGEVHHHFYKSAIVGDQRDFFVYTPPGYDPEREQAVSGALSPARLTATTPAAGPPSAAPTSFSTT